MNNDDPVTIFTTDPDFQINLGDRTNIDFDNPRIIDNNITGKFNPDIARKFDPNLGTETFRFGPSPASTNRDYRGFKYGVNYIFNSDGSVDYKAMLRTRPEFLYVLNEYKDEVEKKYRKSVKDLNVLDIDEKYLCITLPGIRYLADLRGFKSIIHKVESVTYDKYYEVAVACTVSVAITWIGNTETGMQEVTTTDVAGANLRNCFGFTQKYIESMAANRAFVRAVRAYLNIPIVAKDEVGPQENDPFAKLTPIGSEIPAPIQTSSAKPIALLEREVQKLNLTFSQFKSAVKKKYIDKIKSDPDKWNGYEDIPGPDIFVLTSLVNEANTKTTK